MAYESKKQLEEEWKRITRGFAGDSDQGSSLGKIKVGKQLGQIATRTEGGKLGGIDTKQLGKLTTGRLEQPQPKLEEKTSVPKEPQPAATPSPSDQKEPKSVAGMTAEQIKTVHEMIGHAVRETATTLMRSFVGKNELWAKIENQLGTALTSLRDGNIGGGKYVCRGAGGSLSFEDISITSGADLRNFAFGSTLGASNTVTVQDGKIRHGTRTPIAVTGGDIVITENTWIWVEYPYGTGAATLESGADEPVSDATTLKQPLSYWTFADGVATLDHICHVNDINIHGVPETLA